MSWLAPKLNRRVQIGKPSQTENDAGGFDFAFDTVITVWMGLSSLESLSRHIRGEQINENVTHTFIVRKNAVDSLGNECGVGFSDAFGKASLMPLKSDYFLFLQKGSTTRGRLFRIYGMRNVDERNEYYMIEAEEIEERGSGYPE
jgi:hypothetical protein